jgi:hypothetical protein
MGPEYWKPDKPTKLRKCSERRSNSCDPTETDGCCAVIPCSYCLEWITYGGVPQYGVAEFTGTAWVGPIAGVTFVAFWERGYESGECEFVVELDGVEVYRKDCYGGQSCRDSSDTTEATIGYDEGVLSWTRIEKRPLEYIVDPDTGCRTWFCGDCECTCECLCVTITDYMGMLLARGEICDVAYPCDGPIWEGTVGDYLISVALGRDEYGECVVSVSVDGAEIEAIAVSGCDSIAGSLTLENGDRIAFACKVCDCEPDNTTCCPDREVWADSVTMEISDPATCFNLSGVLPKISDTPISYGGEITGTCVYCGITYSFSMQAVISCSANDGWIVEFEFDSPADDCGAKPPDTPVDQISCEPLLLTGDIDCFSCPGVLCPGVPDPPNPPISTPHPPFCPSITISENP